MCCICEVEFNFEAKVIIHSCQFYAVNLKAIPFYLIEKLDPLRISMLIETDIKGTQAMV